MNLLFFSVKLMQNFKLMLIKSLEPNCPKCLIRIN